MINLIVQIGNLIVQVQLYVINELGTSVILRTDYINKNIRLIGPTKKNIVENHSTQVEIISLGDPNEPITTTKEKDPYGLLRHLQIILTLQKKFSDGKVQPVTGTRSERRIFSTDKFISIPLWKESKIIATRKESGFL